MMQLRAACLGLKTAYTVLQVHSASCSTHLQRANFEDGPWVRALDAELHAGLDALLGTPTSEGQRRLAALSTREGGLAFAGVARRSAPAFVGSWALNLQVVADLLGVASVAGFRAKCPTVAADMDRAEAALRQARQWWQACRLAPVPSGEHAKAAGSPGQRG